MHPGRQVEKLRILHLGLRMCQRPSTRREVRGAQAKLPMVHHSAVQRRLRRPMLLIEIA